MEFVLLDNSAFILYSFLLFLALGAALGFMQRRISETLLVSIAFIALSSMLYITSAKGLQFVWINLSIVGYYLLISAVIGIFIDTAIDEKGSVRRHIAGLENFIKRLTKDNRAWYAAAFVAVLLLAAPIWPAYNGVPHSASYNMVEDAAYYGNGTNSSSYLLIDDPPPYNYTIGLCSNGTSAYAHVSVQSKSGPAYAFLFRNLTDVRNVESKAENWPFSEQISIYKSYADASMYSSGTIANSGISMPNYSCSYMVIMIDNLSSIKVSYNISYYGLQHKYVTIREAEPSGLISANSTSNMYSGMVYLARIYAQRKIAALEINSTNSSNSTAS